MIIASERYMFSPIFVKTGQMFRKHKCGDTQTHRLHPFSEAPFKNLHTVSKMCAELAPFYDCNTNDDIMIAIDCTSSPLPDPWLNPLQSLSSQNTKIDSSMHKGTNEQKRAVDHHRSPLRTSQLYARTKCHVAF